MSDFTPSQTGFSRVFAIRGRARSDRNPSYQSCLKMTGLSQGFGDVTSIQCPHPTKYGAFVTLGEIRGEEERPTTSLVGRYAADLASLLLELAKLGYANDVQLHIGQCTDPSSFNEFLKALVFEDMLISSYGTDDLGALEPGEKALVNETAEISAARVYEIVPLMAAERCNDVVTNEMLDVVICDSVSCGECESQSAGCEKMYAISKAAGGSLGTPPDVIFSTDGGATCCARDIDTMTDAEDPTAIACIDTYVVVVSNDTCSLHYCLKSELTCNTVPSWAEVATGFDVRGCPNDMWSVGSFAFIVGDNGWVYACEDPTAGVTVLDAGIATGSKLLGVHALNENFAVAVGEDGAVIYTENQTMWTATTASPVGPGVDLNCVWIKSEWEWLVGSSGGNLYYTLDKGTTWITKPFPGSGAGGVVWDICFSTDSVGYMAHQITAPASGRILRTYDGGHSWVILPEGPTNLPANDSVNALAACSYDPNLVVGVGLADDNADGYVVWLED